MSEKPLLLSSAKSGILLERQRSWSNWHIVAIFFGLIVVGIGTIDVFLRASTLINRVEIPRSAFAPLGTLDFSETVTTSPSSAPVPLVPAILYIPTLNVEAKVEAVGVKSDGKTMAAPKDFADVGWYKAGVEPGAPGNAVFAGHLNSPILLRSGVFEHLADIKLGDRVIVENARGEELTFAVSEIDEYTTELAPVEDIFRISGPSQIVLVTCEGEWDPIRRTFNKRLVVVARLIGS